MLNYHVKIGLVPIRRDCTPRPGIFNWEYAEDRARKTVAYIEEHFTSENVSFVDLKSINEVEVLYNEKDVQPVVDLMRKERADAIFIINSNFGNEEVAAMVTKELGLPVLLWGPLDDVFEPDGCRHTDSQCGLFGVSRQMQRYGVPFSYIENCRVSDPIFADGLDKFVRVACMIKNFRGMRIAQVGLRPKPFCSVIFNEGELMQRFGMHIIPVNMAVIIDKYNRILKERDAELEEGAKILFERYQMDKDTPPLAKKIYAFVLLYKEIFEEYDVDVISSECWTSMQLGVGAMPCTAYSILADMGYIVSCESDMHGAISMALLSCAALGKNPPFFGEFTVRHPEDKNVELLWHCGPFAYSLKKPGTIAREENQRQWFQVKDGKFTICRFDQDDGHYQLLNGTLESADGPYTFGTYLWTRFNNLTKWERKLIDGPYIHHMAEVEGDYTWELREFCRLIPHLDSDTVD